MVFFHHFTATLDDWDPRITNGLARHFEVILFDNVGIGGSEGVAPDTIEAQADDAIAFIKALGYQKVDILALSMGGFTAQVVVQKAPELVRKLILTGTGPQGSEGLLNITEALGQASARTPEDPRLFLFYSPSEESQRIGRSVLARMNARTVDRVPKARLESIQNQLKAILAWGHPQDGSLEKLRAVNHPVWVVNGSHDIMVPTINSYTLFHYLPNAWLSLYPDSGHGAMFQYGERFVKEATEFLLAA
ncbi:alpha/beta fold hydrolase [Larkinella bovis]|uniref:Alpha/beta fold hydrolase n=1 Tax=Larkinella bovis TaxID=683041 RepID=A0ABW0IJT6_9BACT